MTALPSNRLFLTGRRPRSTDEWLVEVGKQVRALRRDAGFSQSDLADRTGLGVATIRRLETGAGANLAAVVEVARVLGRADWLADLRPLAAPILETPPVEVTAWGRLVGYLDDDVDGARFTFTDDWLADGVNLFPLWQAKSRTWVGATTPQFLTGILPDGFAADTARRVFGVTDVAEQLRRLGPNAYGALEFDASQQEPVAGPGRSLNLAELAASCRDLLRHAQLDPVELAELGAVAATVGGRHPKVAVHYNPRTFEVWVAPGPGTAPWLVKLDGVVTDPGVWGRVEFAYHRMATQAGVTMAECKLLGDPDAPYAHFATRRFDRGDGGERFHVQSLPALTGNGGDVFDYEDVFAVAQRIGVPETDRVELFRRVVFNLAAHVTDDHADNIAFMVGADGQWRLAPAFDVVWSPAAVPCGRVAGHATGVGRGTLLKLADRCVIPEPAGIIDEVISAVRAWDDHAGHVSLDGLATAQIRRGLEESIAALR